MRAGCWVCENVYEPSFDPDALKRIKKLCDRETARLALAKFEEIAQKGESYPHEGIRGHPDLCRFRIGSFRFYYGLLTAQRGVVLLGVDRKDKAYRQRTLEKLDVMLSSHASD